MTGPDLQADPARHAAVMRPMQPLLAARTPGAYARAFVASPGPTGPGSARDLGDLNAAAARLGCAMLRARPAEPPALRHAGATVATAGIAVPVVSGGWSPAFDAVCDVAARATGCDVAARATGCDVAARATGGRHVVVASPNHFPQLENADGFNATLDAFLRRSETAPPA